MTYQPPPEGRKTGWTPLERLVCIYILCTTVYLCCFFSEKSLHPVTEQSFGLGGPLLCSSLHRCCGVVSAFGDATVYRILLNFVLSVHTTVGGAHFFVVIFFYRVEDGGGHHGEDGGGVEVDRGQKRQARHVPQGSQGEADVLHGQVRAGVAVGVGM